MARQWFDLALFQGLGGSAEARRRLALILDTLAGQRTVREAAALLGLRARRFHILRRQFLADSLEDLEPRPPGRPCRLVDASASQVTALEAEVRRLRLELQAAQIREEIALTMPHLLRRDIGKKRRRRSGRVRPLASADSPHRPHPGHRAGTGPTNPDPAAARRPAAIQ